MGRDTLNCSLDGDYYNRRFEEVDSKQHSLYKVGDFPATWILQLFIKLEGRRMDPSILLHYIHGPLADEHDLDDRETEKPLLDVEDFWEILQCHWVTDTNKFPHERQRLQLATVLLIAAYTTSRPRALLEIRYGDVKLFVQRDTKTGEVGLMLQIELKKTKSRKKQKRTKQYSFTVDDNPFFCLPSHFVAIAQDDNAFEQLPDGSALTPRKILEMGVRPGLKSQRIPLRSELADVPIFRSHVRTSKGIETSAHTTLQYSNFNTWLKRLGVETGFVQVLTAYCLRRASGNAINDDPNANDPTRNLAMDHADGAIFQRNYLSRMIRYDIQAAYRGTDPKTELIRAAGRMSRLMDPRRPKKLTDEQKEEIRYEPAIKRSGSQCERLFHEIRNEFTFVYRAKGKPIHDQYQRARLDAYAIIRARERAALVEIQARYDATVPLQDMQAQIDGNTESIETQLTRDIVQYSFAERFCLANVFLTSRSKEGYKVADRAAFVDNLIRLCRRYETRVSTRKRKRHSSIKIEVEETKSEDTESEAEEASTLELEEPIAKRNRTCNSPRTTILVDCKPFQCLVCTGRTELSIEDRLHNYGSKDSLKRHFHRTHPKFDDHSVCPHPKCPNVVFEFNTNFLNHAALVHGIIMHKRTWLE
ncbi:hypothetical protein MMC30_007200 [Trapelia coarctata]|nr:hypothetical protein [Trapelia coarctata]